VSDSDLDDGSDKPIGYQTSDGELEVREDVRGERCYHETDLGQHQRWMRAAPDLFEKYIGALDRIRELEARWMPLPPSPQEPTP